MNKTREKLEKRIKELSSSNSVYDNVLGKFLSEATQDIKDDKLFFNCLRNDFDRLKYELDNFECFWMCLSEKE